MSGIALFVPDDNSYFLATQLLQANPNHHIRLIKRIRTSEAVSEAQNAIALGSTIIVARGRQAHFIRQNTNIPVVEIQLTAQELGLLINRAKQLLNKDLLTVGLFGWGNMFCNTDHFNELFHIQLHTYHLESDSDWQTHISAAQAAHCDVIIGGRAIEQFDALMQIPHLYLSGTSESLSNALERAESLYQMSEIEQRNQAQFSAVLYSATNGIIQINSSGKVLLLNRTMEDMLDMHSESVLGKPFSALLPGIDIQKITEVLKGSLENYSGFVMHKTQKLLVVAEPIVVAKQIDGAIISCTNLVQVGASGQTPLKEQLLKGDIALANFDSLAALFPDLSPVLERAKIYALSPSPVLIEATYGPELEMLAQSIHNHSIRKSGPFICISISGMTEEQQSWALFGNPKTGDRGALLSANHGTLVIQAIDKLTLPLQYQLVKAIRQKKISYGTSLSQVKMVDLRIIATTGKNLSQLRKEFRFRSDLLFILKALRIRIPSLKDRPKDIEQMLDTFMKDFCRQYSRYHVLSDGARRAILSYSWEGNIIQLQAFCERMILTVQKRTISEDYVRELLAELYQQDSGIFDETFEDNIEDITDGPTMSGDPIYNLIVTTLQKNHGSRRQTAAELNMSTTTLWRKMKTYHIE